MKIHLLFVSMCVFSLTTLLTSCNTTNQSSTGVELSQIPSMLYVWDSKWSPDGNKIAFVADKKRDPTFPQALYIYDVMTNETVKIPLEAENLSPIKHFGLGELDWSPDGTILSFYGGPYERKELDGIWFLSLDDYAMERITSGDTMAWSPSGDRIAVVETQPLTHSVIKIVNIQNREEQIVYQFDHKSDWIFDIAWSPTGEDLLFTVPETNAEGYAWDKLYHLNLNDSSFTPVFENPQWSMYQPEWLPNGKWIVFIARSPTLGTVTVAPLSGECLFAWLPKISRADSVDVTLDGKKVFVVSWGDLYIVDLEKAVEFYLMPDQLNCP